MECAEFRRIIGTDPKRSSPDLEAHRESCVGCTKYLADMRRLDELVAGALQVAGPKQGAALTRPRRALRWYGLAAGLLVAITAGASIWFARERDALYAEFVMHADGERKVMVVTDKRVPPEKVVSRLEHLHTRLTRELPLSTVRICKIRGVEIPHLIMQTPGGAVHVMVLPGERMLTSHSFEKLGYQGEVMSDHDHLIAIVGATRAAVKQGAALTAGAFDWQN